ncbi:MAG: hypothetical protein AB2A00_30865 [Myxococcota bacterium]
MATTMELMRELKHLSELRKAGGLTAEQEKRLQDIRTILDDEMARRGSSAPKPTPTRTNPAAPAASAPPPPSGRVNAADLNPQGNPNAFKLDLPDELAADVEKSAAKADEALKANKTRPRARNADEAVQQLSDINRGSAYTPPESNLSAMEYFGYGDGYQVVEQPEVDLPVIDSRLADKLRNASTTPSPASGTTTITAMPGGVFLDDFVELYSTGLLVAQDMDLEGGDTSDDPNVLIGKRKVTVHMVSGEVKRGIIQRLGRGELGFTLLPQGAGRSESLSLSQVKAIFVSLNPGQNPLPAAGRMVTVTFKDRRSIQGNSPDYGTGLPTFTLIPPGGKGGFEKVVVNAQECLEVR